MSLSDRLKKGMRNTILGLGLVGMLASCDGNSTIPPPNGNGPAGTVCLEDTAVNYANNIGLPLDVRILDTNNDSKGGCFTNHERDWIDELKLVYDDGVLSAGEVQSFLDYFDTVGPMIPKALNLSYKEFLVDRQFEPDVVDFVPEHLGWIPLNVILPDASLPGLYHDILGEPLTNYPINRTTSFFGLPDWQNQRRGETSTFLSELGICDLCYNTEDALNIGSLDMLFGDREVDDSGLVLKWKEVFAGNLTPGVVNRITIYTRSNDLSGEYNVADVTVDYEVHPDDRSLFDAESLRYVYAHIAPNENQFFGKEDFPFSENDSIDFGTKLGYINWRFNSLLDFSVFVFDQIGVGPYIPVEGFPNTYVMDILGAKDVYPERLRPTATQPRYRDNRVLSPYFLDFNPIPFPNEP